MLAREREKWKDGMKGGNFWNGLRDYVTPSFLSFVVCPLLTGL
jgi:hypothetical protein